MNDKVTLLGVLLFLLCAGCGGGVWYMNGKLVELQSQYDELEQRRVDLEQSTQFLMNQKRVFTESFTALDAYKVSTAASDMDFYSDVQQAARTHGINILSTRQMGVSRTTGRSSIALTLRGDYYNFAQLLAQWRNLQTTVRVAALSITASRTPETNGEIQADVTVEAVVKAK
ncbi:MAG: hypothetical protein LBD04_03925 [Synergistaceae bacterium]|jgi:hypothetical protein|nr:hypothetical protein [Synergistaceae bacterium]